jgi:hypothetical protein
VKEEWRLCFGGDYEVSSVGRVRRVTRARGAVPGRILSPGLIRGYPAVVITFDGERKSRYVHHLVARAFIGPLPGGMGVNHIDGDKANNNVYNLEYCTQAQNMVHASETGLLAVGSQRSSSKLCECSARAAKRLLASGAAMADIARRLGVSASAVSDIATGTTWRHA